MFCGCHCPPLIVHVGARSMALVQHLSQQRAGRVLVAVVPLLPHGHSGASGRRPTHPGAAEPEGSTSGKAAFTSGGSSSSSKGDSGQSRSAGGKSCAKHSGSNNTQPGHSGGGRGGGSPGGTKIRRADGSGKAAGPLRGAERARGGRDEGQEEPDLSLLHGVGTAARVVQLTQSMQVMSCEQMGGVSACRVSVVNSENIYQPRMTWSIDLH